MNQNLSRQKRVLGGVAAAVVAVAGVILLMTSGGRGGAATPDAAIEAIYQHCQAGEYDQTAAYYEGGPADDADMRVSVCEKVTQGRRVRSHETFVKAASDDLVVVQTRNRLTDEPGRTLTWTLVLKRGNWLVREVV